MLSAIVACERARDVPAVADAGMAHSPKHAGMRIWAIGGDVKVLRNGRLVENDYELRFPGYREHNRLFSRATRTVCLNGAGNEDVGFQLVVEAVKEPVRIRCVAGGPFTAEDGSQADFAVRLYQEGYIATKRNWDYGRGRLGAGEYPDYLMPLDGMSVCSIPAGCAQPFWVELGIPATAKGGLYTGNIAVTREGGAIETLRLAVRVWDFALPANASLPVYADIYPSNLAKGERADLYQVDEAARRLIHDYVRLADRHGIAVTVVSSYGIKHRQFDSNGGYIPSSKTWSVYDALWGPILEGRLSHDGKPPKAFSLPFNENFAFQLKQARPGSAEERYYQNMIASWGREVERHFADKGWDISRCFVYTIDEPKSPENEYVRRWAAALKTGTHLRFLLTEQPEESLGDNIDIWAASSGLAWPPQLRAFMQGERRVWFYQGLEPNAPAMNIDTYALALRIYPWIAWKYRLEGILFWCANFWSDDPYILPAEEGSGAGDGVLFYPGAKLTVEGRFYKPGPIPSIRLKALYRGLQDYKYLELLTQLGGKDDAERIVASLVGSALCGGYKPGGGYEKVSNNEEGRYMNFWEDPRLHTLTQWSKNPDAWEAAREELANAIMRRKR